MNILIDNAGFINKGAELMLYAAMEKMKEFYPKANFVFRAKIPYKIKGLYELRDQKRQNLIPVKLLPQFVKTCIYGFLSIEDIDLVIDAAGFRFGDQWEKHYTLDGIKKDINFYKEFHARGKKIICLPQAFGPFNQELSKLFIKEIYPYINLFFAREKESYENLIQIFGNDKKILLFPDFTSIYKPKLSHSEKEDFKNFKNKICIVPNKKMITHTNKKIADNYLEFLLNITNQLENSGEKVFLLNHEGIGDEEIIKEIVTKIKHNIEYLSNLNANQVKYVIGQSKICITSRFHGLVSALSQGVPAFCTSWSHKYQELLNDYDFDKGLLDVNDAEQSYTKIVEIVKDNNKYQNLSTKLKTKSQEQQNKTNEMWQIIKNHLT